MRWAKMKAGEVEWSGQGQRGTACSRGVGIGREATIVEWADRERRV